MRRLRARDFVFWGVGLSSAANYYSAVQYSAVAENRTLPTFVGQSPSQDVLCYLSSATSSGRGYGRDKLQSAALLLVS